MPKRAGWVAEADRRQPVVRLRGGELLLFGRQARNRRQQRPIEQAHVDFTHLALDPLPERPDTRTVGGEMRGAREGA